MSTRHHAREVALQILYRQDLATHALPIAVSLTAIDIAKELTHHFEHFQVAPGSREFIGQLVAGTLLKRQEIDPLIEKHASNWKVGRMGFVDRSLLRMAVYELMSFPDTPPSVVIDEAIELSKQFGTAETPAFVNGILDSIKNELKAPAKTALS